MMTNQEILQIALQQSALDCNCNPEDFLSSENKVVLSKKTKRQGLISPFLLSAIWYLTATISLLR